MDSKNDGFIAKFNETTINKKFEIMTFESTFNKAKFNSIYSNLDTISFYKIMTNMKDLEERGYNNRLLSEKKHYYLSLPFFLVLMICLAAIFTLSTSEKKQNIYYIILSIITCVIIFYFKNFSMALGNNRTNSIRNFCLVANYYFNAFCSIGIMQINEK